MSKLSPMTIPVFDIKRQNKEIGKEIKLAMMQVMDKGVYILGGKVEEFEKEFANYLGVKYAVGVGSGTDAISLSLLALGISTGDEVIMPANSYPSVFAVTAIGAVPKLADINPRTYTIDPDKIPKVITKRTKAILPVHMYGQAAEMEPILAIGHKHGIPVVEDCAQGHGVWVRISTNKPINTNNPINGKIRFKNSKVGSDKDTSEVTQKGSSDGGGIWKKAGSLGTLGCFSFYPTKNLGCFGDGGMVVTNNKELADKVRLLRMYGEKGRYNSILAGRNSRLDELQAAILLVKLKYLDKWNSQRRVIAKEYITQIPVLLSSRAIRRGDPVGITEVSRDCFVATDSASRNDIKLPIEAFYTRHIYHLFVIRTKRRDELKSYLEKKGIMTAIHYPTPVHLIPSMKYLGYKKGDFSQSEKASREVLSLPMFPELREKEVEKVVEGIRRFSGQ